MGKASNRSIVHKADLAVANLQANGGYLNTIQSNTFIRMLIDQPTLINEIRTVPMNAPTMELNKIGFADRILQVAPTSGTALDANKRSRPITDQVNLTTKKVMAEVHLPYDVLEDNIERGALEDTIMSLITERVSTDLEELIIDGGTDASDDYLELVDGVFELSTSNVLDYSGLSAEINKTIFKNGIHAMPNKYLRKRDSMRFYVSPNLELEYADSLANRETEMLGDSNIRRNMRNFAYGVPVKPVALMPDSKYLFTFPKNIIFGVQRDIMIESDRDIRTQVLIVVVTMRMDLVYEEEEAVVTATGLPDDFGVSMPTTTT